jgi:hypothetical protein
MVIEPKNAVVAVVTVAPPRFGVRYAPDHAEPSMLCSKVRVPENVPLTDAEQTEYPVKRLICVTVPAGHEPPPVQTALSEFVTGRCGSAAPGCPCAARAGTGTSSMASSKRIFISNPRA